MYGVIGNFDAGLNPLDAGLPSSAAPATAYTAQFPAGSWTFTAAQTGRYKFIAWDSGGSGVNGGRAATQAAISRSLGNLLKGRPSASSWGRPQRAKRRRSRHPLRSPPEAL